MNKWCQGSCTTYNSTFTSIESKLPHVCPFRQLIQVLLKPVGVISVVND